MLATHSFFPFEELAMLEGFAHERYRLLGDRVTGSTLSNCYGGSIPTVEVTRQAGCLGNADMFAFDRLAVTTDAVQLLTPRMFAQVLAMTKLDSAVEQQGILSFHLNVTAFTLAGVVGNQGVRLI